MTVNVGIHVRSTSDTRGFQNLQREERELLNVTRQTERSLEDVGEETEELRRRIERYSKAVRQASLAQQELGKNLSEYDVRGVVRAYERERYELGRRREVNKQDWRERRQYLKEEREERDKVRQKTIEQGIADRKVARDAEWASRRRKQAIIDFAEEGIFTAVAAMGTFAYESANAWAEFDQGMRQVATITDGGITVLDDLNDDALRLSKKMSVLPNEMGRMIYQAESLGSIDVFADTEESARAAVAGAADFEDTLSAGLKTLNAYQDGMYQLSDVHDIFFKAIDLGAIEMSDLASGISEVTSVAGESGTRLEDVAAALVTMTKQGDSFNEAVELSSLLLTQLSLEGTQAANSFVEATGQSYRDFIANGGNLAEALQALQDHADATGKSVGAIIAGDSPFYRDQQAARAAMELTGHHLDTMTDSIVEMYGAAGTMEEAYAIASEGAQRDLDDLAVSWQILQVRTGEYLMSLGFVQTGIENVSDALYFLSGGHQSELEVVIARTTANMTLAESFHHLDGAIQNTHNMSSNALDDTLKQSMEELFYGIAAGATTVEELQVKATELGVELDEVFGRERGGDATHRLILRTENGIVSLGEATEVLGTIADREYKRIEEAAARMTVQTVDHFLSLENQLKTVTEQITASATDVSNSLVEAQKVLDGDTVRFEFGDVRLVGINTPEVAKKLFEESMPFGQEALAFTQEFLIDPEITFADSGRQDKFGRALGDLINESGQSLSEEMVRRGLALPLPVELTEDPHMSQRLSMIARSAAAQGRGIFEREEMATAFIDGLIGTQDEWTQYYEHLQAQDQAYYGSYVGLIQTAVDSHEVLQEQLRETAIEQLLTHGNLEMIPNILDTAVALGVYTEEEVVLKEALTLSTFAIEEQALIMGQAENATLDMYETTELLTTGLFSSREEAERVAEFLSADLVDAFIAAHEEGMTVVEVGDAIGVSLANIPSEKTISFVSDTSRWHPPAGVNYNDGDVVKQGNDAGVPAGIIPTESGTGGSNTYNMGGDTININESGDAQATAAAIEAAKQERFRQVMR